MPAHQTIHGLMNNFPILQLSSWSVGERLGKQAKTLASSNAQDDHLPPQLGDLRVRNLYLALYIAAYCSTNGEAKSK